MTTNEIKLSVTKVNFDYTGNIFDVHIRITFSNDEGDKTYSDYEIDRVEILSEHKFIPWTHLRLIQDFIIESKIFDMKIEVPKDIRRNEP